MNLIILQIDMEAQYCLSQNLKLQKQQEEIVIVRIPLQGDEQDNGKQNLVEESEKLEIYIFFACIHFKYSRYRLGLLVYEW